MPKAALLSLGKALSNIPLLDKTPISLLGDKHAIIVRHINEPGQADTFSIRAMDGAVGIKRLADYVYLEQGAGGDYGQGSWLVPGDVIQLLDTPIEFIFDHPEP